jgi:hypothetical protein
MVNGWTLRSRIQTVVQPLKIVQFEAMFVDVIINGIIPEVRP